MADIVLENSVQAKGKALESSVEYLFKTAGFETYTNQIVALYEIDVLVKIGDQTIILECKNYQNASMIIRNLIHQWNSKNSLIRADKIILVLAGLSVKPEDYALASEFNMLIWNEEDLANFYRLSTQPHQLREQILKLLQLDGNIDILHLYRDEITRLIVFPLLSGQSMNLEIVYKHFNHWLRVRARTDLRLRMAEVNEINQHIELFEGTKKKKVFFFQVNRSEKEYWLELEQRLKQTYFQEESKLRYLDYMNMLQDELNNQNMFFSKIPYLEGVKRLIQARIQLLIKSYSPACKLGFSEKQIIQIEHMGQLQFKIKINAISEEVANIVSWFLTSEYSLENYDAMSFYIWINSEIEDTANKVFRIFEEVFGIQENKRLYDFSLN